MSYTAGENSQAKVWFLIGFENDYNHVKLDIDLGKKERRWRRREGAGRRNTYLETKFFPFLGIKDFLFSFFCCIFWLQNHMSYFFFD